MFFNLGSVIVIISFLCVGIFSLDLHAEKNYKIQNVENGLVLDASGKNTANGAKIISFHYLNGKNQQWSFKAQQVGVHGTYIHWQISTADSNQLQVLDQDQHTSVLQLWNWWGPTNQLWHLRPLAPGSNIFTINSVYNEKAITSNGAGTTTTCESPSKTNTLQQWRIIEV